MNKIIKKINLENFPKHNGYGKKNIDWVNSKGCSGTFLYDGIYGEFNIIDYIKEDRMLLVSYNNNIFKMKPDQILYCQFGTILGRIYSDFKFKVGDIVNNLEILDYIKIKDKNNKLLKYYKYKCKKDNYIGQISEYNLMKGHGCPVCTNRVALLGVNTIWDTDKWMIPFVGEEISKRFTSKSNQYVYPICNVCGSRKKNKMKISDIYRYHGFKCNICNDNISYSEKLMYYLLRELNVKFITQYGKTNSKWCNNYRYDFYFEYNNEKYIIETHGEQHYKQVNNTWDKLEHVQQNDKNKYELAIHNGIKTENYIVIDCRKSDLEFIKNNIINSKLNEIFDLSNIDWLKAEENIRNSFVKKVCDIKRNNNELYASQIGEMLGFSTPTIIKWLKIGNKLGWCNYNPKEETDRNNKAINRRNNPIEVFKDNKSLGIFKNGMDIERHSKELFGVELKSKCISNCLRGIVKTYKGYTFVRCTCDNNQQLQQMNNESSEEIAKIQEVKIEQSQI